MSNYCHLIQTIAKRLSSSNKSTGNCAKDYRLCGGLPINLLHKIFVMVVIA